MSTETLEMKSNDFQVSEQQTIKSTKDGTIKLYLASFVACLGPFIAGTAMGYSSTAGPQLTNSNDTDAQLVITDNEKSWFDGLLSLGAVIGGLIGGIIVGFIGYKKSLFLTAIVYTTGLLLVSFSYNLAMILSGRCLVGIGIGFSSLIVPVYIAELSPPSLRGSLGSCFQLFLVIGVLFSFVVGTFTTWHWLAIICACFPITMFIFMIFMPEGPRWLLRKNLRDRAIESLKWVRRTDANVINECDELESFLKQEGKMNFKEILQPSLLKPVLITVLIMILQQFSGVNAVTFNTKAIFLDAMPSFDSNLASIIMGITQVVATLSSVFLIERFGRKVLLIGSAIIMGAMCILFGIFYYFFHAEGKATWLPLFCIIVYIVAFSCGVGPVPWVVMAEFIPGRAKGVATGIAVIANWASVFCTTKEFLDMENAMADYGTFWFFGAVCFAGVLFVFKFVPETKGRTLEEITKSFLSKK